MSMMCRPKWLFLHVYGSHDMRLVDFRGLTGSQRTPWNWGVTGPIRLRSTWWFQFGGVRDGDCPIPRTSISDRLIIDSWMARFCRLDRGGIRFPTQTYLSLSFTGGIAIKQPHNSLYSFFFLQILGTVRVVRNLRNEILTPGPRRVSTLERPFSLDLYHSGGSSDYLRKRKKALGTVSFSPPIRSRRRTRTPA